MLSIACINLIFAVMNTLMQWPSLTFKSLGSEVIRLWGGGSDASVTHRRWPYVLLCLTGKIMSSVCLPCLVSSFCEHIPGNVFAKKKREQIIYTLKVTKCTNFIDMLVHNSAEGRWFVY